MVPAQNQYPPLRNRSREGVAPRLVIMVLTLWSLLPARTAAQSVEPLPTTETVLLGRFSQGPFGLPLYVGQDEFESSFGSTNPTGYPAEVQARQFFANNGTSLHVIRISDSDSLVDALIGNSEALTGLRAIEPLSDVRLLIAPELSLLDSGAFATAFAAIRNFCDEHGIFLILDPPPGLTDIAAFTNWAAANLPGNASGCAIYYPYLQVQIEGKDLTVPASGAIAAVYAQNDADYGIWHSPAGSSFPLAAANTTPVLTSSESDSMTVQNLNAIRVFSGIGIVPWSARTLDRLDSDNRYVPIVRLRSWIDASLKRSLAFAATNDNDSALWTQLRGTAENFLQTLFMQGAFAGVKPSEAYFVRCDSTTTTATDIALHRANLLYGIAPLQPAEFMISTITMPTYDPAREPPRPVLRARLFQGELHLSYPTTSGFDYGLQSATRDVSGEWDPVDEIASGDGAWKHSAESVALGDAFYRVRVTAGR